MAIGPYLLQDGSHLTFSIDHSVCVLQLSKSIEVSYQVHAPSEQSASVPMEKTSAGCCASEWPSIREHG